MNNTIKIPVKVTTVEETLVEVELPCYTRVENTWFAISEENKGVDVYISSIGTVIISNSLVVSRAFATGHKLITKAEYDEQFEKALSIIKGEQL